MFQYGHDKENHYAAIGFGDSGCNALKILNSSRFFDNLESIYIPSAQAPKANLATSLFSSNRSEIWLSIVLVDSLCEFGLEQLLSLLAELKTKSLYSVVIMDGILSETSDNTMFKKMAQEVDSIISLNPQSIASISQCAESIGNGNTTELTLVHLTQALLSFVLERGVYGIDSTDLKHALAGNGLITSAVSRAQGIGRAKSAFKEAINNLGANNSNHGNVAVCVWASKDFSIEELNIIEDLVDQYTEGASIIDLQWHDDLNNQCIITIFETELPST